MTSAPARFAVAAGITATAVLALAVSWLAWRLTSVGPLLLPWLVAPVERALGGDGETLRVDVEAVALAWPSRRSLPELMVLGLVVARADGTEIGRLPELSIRPSGRALVRGRIAVGAVGLSGIRLAFVRGADGRLGFGEQAAGDPAGPGSLSPALVELLAKPPAPESPVGWLRVVRIRGAEILLDDRVIDARWTLGAADVDLLRRAGTIEATVRATLALAMKPANVTVPLNASARTSLDDAGAYAAIEFDARGEGGRLALDGSKPVTLRTFATEGRFGIADASVDLRALAVETSAGDLSASASLSFADGRFAARTEGEVRRVPADRVAVFWPAPVADEARSWVTERLTEGIVPRATFSIRHGRTTSFRLDIAFSGMTLDYLAPLRPLRNAAGSVLVTPERLEVRLDGAEAGALRIARGTFDAPLGTKPIPATVVVEVAGPAADLVAFLDERPIELSRRFAVPAGLEAEATARAELRFPLSGELGRGDLRVEASGTLAGRDVDATIETRLAGDGVEHLAISPLRYGRNRLTLEAHAEGDGAYRVSLAGASGDLRPFLERVRHGEGSAPSTTPELRVAFDLDRVHLGAATEIRDARGEGRLASGRIAALDARGISPGGGAATVRIEPSGIGRSIALDSERAGELLRALEILSHVEGGKLELRAEVDDRTPDGRTTGQLDLRDFRVVRAPLLAKILSVGSFDGIADLLRGDGLAFRQARLPFVWSAGRLELTGATAIGAIGLTADGVVDRERERLDLRGEVIPAYTLNSALGSVPILGSLLAGADGKGVFGIEYRAKGSLEKPDVDTSVLASLAPRRLREMFLDPFRGG